MATLSATSLCVFLTGIWCSNRKEGERAPPSPLTGCPLPRHTVGEDGGVEALEGGLDHGVDHLEEDVVLREAGVEQVVERRAGRPPPLRGGGR